MFKIKINKKVIRISFILILILYIFALASEFGGTNFTHSFQYDSQILWQSLERFSQGEMVFKDFLHGFGNLFMLFGLPFYLIFGKTFRALMLVRRVFLPAFAVIFSFISGFLLLNPPFTLIYFFLLLIYQTNWHFTSLRHTVPELGLVIAMTGVLKGNNRLITLSGLIVGLSFGLTLDYPIFASLTLLIFISSSWIFLKKKVKKSHLLNLFLSFILGLSAYIVFAYSNGLLLNKIKYTRSITKDLYAYSPTRGMFPRPEYITNEPLLIKLLPNLTFPLPIIKFFLALPHRRLLNFYLVPLILTGFSVYVLLTELEKRKKVILLTMFIYSGLAFYRTLNSPAMIKFSFGLNLFFLALAYLLQITKDNIAKIFLVLIIGWFVLTPKNRLISFFKFHQPRKTDVKVSGVYVSQKVGNQYKEITKYIKARTSADDKIYVYPYGPYYQLADRSSSLFPTGSWQYGIAPFIVDKAYAQLKDNPPKLVIINRRARDIRSSIRRLKQEIHLLENRIVIEGPETKIHNFIENNYVLSKEFPIAYILERGEHLNMPDTYIPVNKKVNWKIKQVEDEFIVDYSSLPEFDLGKFWVEVNLPPWKILSKYAVNIHGTTPKEDVYFITNQTASGEKQELFVYPHKRKYEYLTVSLSENYGFLWWGKPKFKVYEPKLFKYNPELNLKDE